MNDKNMIYPTCSRADMNNISQVRLDRLPVHFIILFIVLTVMRIMFHYFSEPPIGRAILWGNFKKLKKVVDQGIDVNGKIDQWTMLTYTMRYMDSSINTINILPTLEDKIKELKKRNKTRIEMIKILLDAGADINAKDDFGKTILHWAVTCSRDQYEEADVELVKFLVENGADINAKDNHNETPLQRAPELIKKILEIKNNAKQ